MELVSGDAASGEEDPYGAPDPRDAFFDPAAELFLERVGGPAASVEAKRGRETMNLPGEQTAP